MRYFLAIVFPPLAVLLCGKPFSAILNLIILLPTLWIGGIIHAIVVVNSYNLEKSTKRIEKAIVSSARVAHQDAVRNR